MSKLMALFLSSNAPQGPENWAESHPSGQGRYGVSGNSYMVMRLPASVN